MSESPNQARSVAKAAAALNVGGKSSAAPLTGKRPIELVFGLVGPTGVDQAAVAAALIRQLAAMNYESVEISLSDVIAGYDSNGLRFEDEFDRISSLMSMGDDLRRRAERADIIALLGIIKIRAERARISGKQTEPSETRRIAYLVRSFKRPEEVALFRDVYGKAFSLISIYASRPSRIENLRKRFIGRNRGPKDERTPSELAHHLMNRDNKEESDEDYGQRVGDTFPLADYFVVSEIRSKIDKQLERLVRLIFGDPYISPSADEQAMYFAQVAALRSLDLSRQVGAAIVAEDGSLVSTGCNDVPRAGGGLYWADDESCERDFERGLDANVEVKKELVIDALNRLKGAKLLNLPEGENIENLAKKLLFDKPAVLGDSKLFDVIEFGRSVHAEMAAITHAARVGSATDGMRLFCTTFPCHICARHIVSSGIKEVVFIEPYEKSRVAELYQDSIVVEPVEKSTDRVAFRSFFGVAPRRYLDFFQPATSRKSRSGSIRPIQEIAQNPRIKRITFTYTSAEEAVISEATLPPKGPTPTKESSP